MQKCNIEHSGLHPVINIEAMSSFYIFFRALSHGLHLPHKGWSISKAPDITLPSPPVYNFRPLSTTSRLQTRAGSADSCGSRLWLGWAFGWLRIGLYMWLATSCSDLGVDGELSTRLACEQWITGAFVSGHAGACSWRRTCLVVGELVWRRPSRRLGGHRLALHYPRTAN